MKMNENSFIHTTALGWIIIRTIQSNTENKTIGLQRKSKSQNRVILYS